MYYTGFSISNRHSSPIILAPVFREIEARISRVEGHPQPHNEFEAILGYIRDSVSNKGTHLVGDTVPKRLELKPASSFFSVSIGLKGKGQRLGRC